MKKLTREQLFAAPTRIAYRENARLERAKLAVAAARDPYFHVAATPLG
jgi:hypothetical protein